LLYVTTFDKSITKKGEKYRSTKSHQRESRIGKIGGVSYDSHIVIIAEKFNKKK